MEYYLLLIDIRGSTRLAPQKSRQVIEKLEVKLREINSNLKPSPTVDLSISYGDEIAGLFATPVSLFDVVRKVRDVLRPDVCLRFVATRGEIAVLSKDIRKVGGQVFKKANEAMQQIKKKKKFCQWLIGDPIWNAALNSLTEMSNAFFEDMSMYQREVFYLLERGFLQRDIAEKLSKHPQSVSDAVKRGKAELILEAQKTIKNVLKSLNQ